MKLLCLLSMLLVSHAFSATGTAWDEYLGAYSRVEFQNGLDDDDSFVTNNECPLEINIIETEGNIAITTKSARTVSGEFRLHSWEIDNSCEEWDHYHNKSVHEKRCNSFSDQEVKQVSSTSAYMFYSKTTAKLKVSENDEILFSKNYQGLALNPLRISQSVKCKYRKI